MEEIKLKRKEYFFTFHRQNLFAYGIPMMSEQQGLMLTRLLHALIPPLEGRNVCLGIIRYLWTNNMRHAKLKLGIFFVSMMLFLISCQLPEDEIRAKMDSTIPIGSSKDEILRFLEANSFEFMTNPKEFARPDGIKAEWITAVRKERILFRDAYTRGDFFFDEQNRTLMKYEIYTSYPARSFLFW